MKKEAIILANKVVLVSDNEYVEMSIVVPARNISKMIEQTGAFVLKKEVVKVSHNHYAGTLYKTTIRVVFGKISKYMIRSWVGYCDNCADYHSLLNDKDPGHFEVNLPSEKMALYAFGDCSKYENYNMANVLYYDKAGRRISLQHSAQNDYGKRRIINFKGHYYSNRQF